MSLRTGVSLGVLIGVICLSLSSNPPQGNSGAPFDGSCNRFGCHFSGGFLMGEVKLVGIPEIAVRGMSYNFSVQIISTSGSPVRGGFQMVAVGDDALDAGELSDPGSNATLSSFNSRTYFEHQPAKQFNNADIVEYTGTWTAPTDFINDESTTFYISSILANGNNNPTGDTYLRTNFTTMLKVDTTIIEDCNQDISLSTPTENILPGNYLSARTNESIFSNQIINSKGSLSLTAKKAIEVNAGFEVEQNALLTANIDDCQNQ